MSSELKNSSYIKDVETYFLKITGKGLMLSGKDYSLINSWYLQSISRETLYKAIQNAVIKNDDSKMRGIFSIKDDIECYIKSVSERRTETSSVTNSLSKTSVLKPVIEKIQSAVRENQNDKLKELFQELLVDIKRIQQNKESNLFKELKKTERDFLEKYFSNLDVKSQKEIMDKAHSQMPPESRYFDEQSKTSSLTAFRNEIILKQLSLQNLFELK